MTERPKFPPNEGNLGKECIFWKTQNREYTCAYPNSQLSERRSCEGIVDDICLFLVNKRTPTSLTEEQIQEITDLPPQIGGGRRLPPGEIK